ncbi:MAG: AAA family ATPase, partial [Thermodesulfobacteriota bacterium]
MLSELNIKNFAIIENLSISFGKGLNVFTGETGAGKSIIIGALNLILGDRASGDVIRSGEEEAQVEALFDLTGERYDQMKERFKDSGVECEDSLLVRRIVHKTGRNKIYINDNLATLLTLTEVVSPLVDICGQSEHESLTRADEHIEVLDNFGELMPLREEMADVYRQWRTLKRDVDGIQKNTEKESDEKDLLEFQLNEIKSAALIDGEDVSLKNEKERLLNAAKLATETSVAERTLYSDNGSVVEKLGGVVKSLKELATLDGNLKDPCDAIEKSLFEIEEAAATLRDYPSTVEFEPSRLEELDERLNLINTLKKKYGVSISEILGKCKNIERDLIKITGSETDIDTLTARMDEAYTKALELAGHLTDARKQAAAIFKK